MKECIQKASTAEIAFVRDIMANANPSLLESGQGFKMRPAGEENTEEVEIAPVATPKSNLPPASVLKPDEVNLVKVAEEEMVRLIKFRLPFTEDLEIWDTFKMDGGSELVKDYLKEHLPPGTEVNTDNDDYVKAVLITLFNNGYVKEHSIPPPEQAMELSSFPSVPKAMIIFLHELGEDAHKKDNKFDLERYWLYLRQHFAPSATARAIGRKPTAAALFNTASGVVADENQMQRMLKGLSQSTMKEYLKERSDLRGSPGANSPNKDQEVAVPEESKQEEGDTAQDPDVTANTTVLGLRSHNVVASKSTEVSYNREGIVTRRRTHEQFKSEDSESSAAKKQKK